MVKASEPVLRWMNRRDMPEVLAIEGQCFDHPWSEAEFIRCLRQRNCIGMVVEHSDRVVGYMIYELHKNRLHLLSLAVAPACHRSGVGRMMVDKLRSKLSYDRRNRIMVEVRESNLDAHLFFRSFGFRAVSVIRDFYVDSAEDAYLFCYRHPTAIDEQALAEAVSRS